MREDWAECCFEDLLDYEQPTNYIVESTNYNDGFNTPVLTAGKSFILGYTNETTGIFKSLPTIIFDDFTTASQFVDFEFKVKSSAMKILVPTSKLVNLKFVFYCMQVNKVRSDTHKRYWISVFAKNKLQLPPITIQKAIVNKIENLFLNIDKGIADLKTAQEQLKVYRQAVLSLAVNNSKKVPISELVTNLSQGWSPKCLNEHSKNNDEWAVIKTTAIQSLQFIDSENKILPPNLEPRKQHEINIGDILITRAGPRIRVGICCLVRNTRPNLINCDKVYRLKVNKTKILPEFFEYSLNSPEHLRLIEKIKTGSSDSGLNLTQDRFLSIEIPLPEPSEQRKIIKEIESRITVCDKVEQSIAEALDKAEAMRQSILKKAFEGKLLSEVEIAKCKQEADYEPARELLKKIKAEKK